METIDCIKSRRSIRSFQEKAVPNDIISDIIEVARYAPSWKNSATARYIVVNNKAIKDRLADEAFTASKSNANIVKNAPSIVIVCSKCARSGYERDGSFSTTKGRHFESFDAGIATQTFALAAHDMGVDSLIMGIFDEDTVVKVLDIPSDLSVSAVVAIGYRTDDVPTPRRRELDEILTFID